MIKSGAYRISLRFQSSMAAKVGTEFRTREEITKFLNTPTWDVSELLNSKKATSKRASEIDDETVKRLLNLSGLDTSVLSIHDIKSTLKSQVLFVDHLHSLPEEDVPVKCSTKSLTYQELLENVKKLKQDPLKGEINKSWYPLELAQESKHGHYIVKEGLIKNK